MHSEKTGRGANIIVLMADTLPLMPTPSSETFLSRGIKFWLFLGMQIPSVLCAIFVLSYMSCRPRYRRLLANHAIMALVLVSLLSSTVDLSIMLHFLRAGRVEPPSPRFCLFWMFIDHYLYASGMLLMAWASIERHMFIFASSYFRSFRSIVLLHYLPLGFCFVYPCLFYLSNLLLFPCRQHSLNYNAILCGSSCFKLESWILDWFDMISHSVLPCLLIIGSSLSLLIRVVRQKRRIQQNRFSWRRQRRMLVQLVAIASLYIVMNAPLFIVLLIRKCFIPTFAGVEYKNYLFYFYLILIMFVPFICVGSLGPVRRRSLTLLQKLGIIKTPVMPNITDQHRPKRPVVQTIPATS